MVTWDAAQYLRFEAERTRPCSDLVQRIALDAPARIADLGCGPGTSTDVLHARWPRAQLTGIDASPEMLERARRSGVPARWVASDIRRWSPRSRFDLVFSNAALQWLPNSARELPRLLGKVRPGGALAFQVPANDEGSGSWRGALRAVTRRHRWGAFFRDPPPPPSVEPLAAYFDRLAPLSRRVDLWDTRYLHPLADPRAIVEWVRGTGLRPWLERLPDESTREEFLADLEKAFDRTFPRRSDGSRLFPFLRRFVIAYR